MCVVLNAMVLLEEVDDDGTPVLTRRKLGREDDDGGADHSGEEDGEGGDGEEEGDEKKTRKKKGLAWGPLLMLIFMFGSSIGGAVLVALEYLGVTGGAKPGVDTTDTGYYWCVASSCSLLPSSSYSHRCTGAASRCRGHP